MDGFRKVLEVNLMSLMACATKFHAMLSASKGSLIIVSSTGPITRPWAIPPTTLQRPARWGSPGPGRKHGRSTASAQRIAPGLVDTKMTKATTANPKRLEGRWNESR